MTREVTREGGGALAERLLRGVTRLATRTWLTCLYGRPGIPMPNVSAVLYKRRLYMCEVAQKTNVRPTVVQWTRERHAIALI